MVGSPGGIEVGRLNLKVLPDTTGFVPEVEKFIVRVEHQLKVELPLTIDTKQAWKDLKKFKVKTEAESLNVDMEVDTATAVAHVGEAMAEMKAITAPNLHVEVELDGAGVAAAKAAATEAATSGTATVSHIGRQIALWGPLIFIAAAGIAALAPALAVVLPLVVAIGASAAVLALGWKQVKDIIKPLADDFKKLRKEVGGALTQGLGPLIKTFSDKFMPVLTEALVQFATFINGALKGMLRFLNGSNGLGLVSQLFAELGPALAPFARLLPLVTSVFLRLTIAALPALQVMGKALVDITTRFDTFLKKGTASAAITTAMNDLGAVFVVIGRLVRDVFPALVAVFPAVVAVLSGFGETVGGLFKLLLPVFAIIAEHQTTVGAFGAALAVLAIGFGTVAAATAAWNAVLALNPWTRVIIGVTALAAGLIYAYKHSETFRVKVDAAWQAIQNFGNRLKPILPTLAKIGIGIGAVVAALVVARTAFVAIRAVLVAFRAVMLAVNIIMAANPFVLVALAVVALGVALVVAYKKSETFRNIVNAVWSAIKTAISTAIAFIVDHLKLFIDALLVIGGPIVLLVGLVINHFGTIKTFIITVFTAVWAFLVSIWNAIKTVFTIGIAYIKFQFTLISSVVGIVVAVFSAVVNFIVGVWGRIKGAVSAGIGAVVGAFRLIGSVVAVVASAFGRVVAAVASGISRAVTTVKGLPGKIKSALVGLTSMLYDIGKNMMQGMINGIKNMAQTLINKAKSVVGSAVSAAKSALGIKSPSRVFMQIGVFTMKGFEIGLGKQGKSVIRTMEGVMGNATDVVSGVFDPKNIGSGAMSLESSIGAIVDNTDSPHAQEVLINWNTGRGVMMDIAEDEMARKAFLTSQEQLMGV